MIQLCWIELGEKCHYQCFMPSFSKVLIDNSSGNKAIFLFPLNSSHEPTECYNEIRCALRKHLFPLTDEEVIGMF